MLLAERVFLYWSMEAIWPMVARSGTSGTLAGNWRSRRVARTGSTATLSTTGSKSGRIRDLTCKERLLMAACRPGDDCSVQGVKLSEAFDNEVHKIEAEKISLGLRVGSITS
jgi:hypothetical protein